MIPSELRKHVDGDFLIAGVGNEDSETDRIGLEIARKGKEAYPDKFIDCGVAPENYLGFVVERGVKTLIIVDAVHFQSEEEARVFLPGQLSLQGISTHSLSLRLMAQYLSHYGIETLILGVKPGKHLQEMGEKILGVLLQLIRERQRRTMGATEL